MLLDFRIDWGYQYLYSRRHYHPIFIWDGALQCRNGRLLELYQLDYPVIWYGPGHCPRETRLPTAQWRSRTRRGLAGVRARVEGTAETEFDLHTASGDFRFRAADLLQEGRLVFPVGPKYLNCHVLVTRTGYLWYRPAPRQGQLVWEAADLALEQHDWARMQLAWLPPNGRVEFSAELPESAADYRETLLHLVAMAAPACTPGNEKQVHDTFPLALYCDGELAVAGKHYFREHDGVMQMLEDVWLRFQAEPGRHLFALENRHPEFYLLLSRLLLQPVTRQHGELSLPAWGLQAERLIGKVFAVRPDRFSLSWPGGGCELTAQPGWNEFDFSLPQSGRRLPMHNGRQSAFIDAVYALPEEALPILVGCDLTVVPHDANGFMDWLLDYTWRTRLGNLVVFRSFLLEKSSATPLPVETNLLRRWGEYCRTHGIHVEAATDFDDGALVEGAGELLHSVGRHEYPGAVYARDPAEPWASNDMREATEHYLDYLKIEIDRAHRAAPRAAFGDASGGHRYCYLAGADFIRTETMVPHTQHLCSQARPAAEALSSGEWGVHIAIQHPVQPYFEHHLGLYFLSLMQPWMMGAGMIYEEDSLFLLFKEERQSWDDALTKGKRDMTRDFFRFAKTHPRSGRCVRRIAFLEGRYAAPFNGFICDVDQTPDYSVWGYFGKQAPEWGHRQPEKCRQLLDVLMPGASTLPLRQKFEKRRFFFSGTPYGDFDETPIEASAAYLSQYRLLLHLGWNTMLREDYVKLREYVRHGGVLLTGLPQFSTHCRRDFLKDFADLALWQAGDLSELCGIRVKGPGHVYSGQWNGAGRANFPEPELAGLPNADPEEDGPARLAEVELAGADVLAWDADHAGPMLVRNDFGAGRVYTLTFWAYPGHEKFQRFSAGWLARLAAEAQGALRVADPTGDVFWTVWEDRANRCSRLLLLNTDWSAAGNRKRVRIFTAFGDFDCEVREREATIITVLPDGAIAVPMHAHLRCEKEKLWLHGCGKIPLTVFAAGRPPGNVCVDLGNRTVAELVITPNAVGLA